MSLFPTNGAASFLLNDNFAAQPIAHMTHGSPVLYVAFSPDGKYVVSGSDDNTARIWETTTGLEIGRITYDDGVSSVAFSLDGKYVVSGSYDNTARIWEAATGEEVARMTHDGRVSSVALNPDGGVYSVAFSPDGKYVVSGSDDNTARVWEATTGEEIARMTHDNWVLSVAFSPDSKYVVSGGFFDDTARVWVWQADDLIANACALMPATSPALSGCNIWATRHLTLQNRKMRFVPICQSSQNQPQRHDLIK